MADSLQPHELYSLPGSVHGILQARLLEWAAMPSSRGSSQPRNRTCVSCIAGEIFTTEPSGKPHTSQYIAFLKVIPHVAPRGTLPCKQARDGEGWNKLLGFLEATTCCGAEGNEMEEMGKKKASKMDPQYCQTGCLDT